MALKHRQHDNAPKEKKLSKKEELALKKQQEEEEAARIAAERIQAEREELMKLTEKELLVELILSVRGYNDRITNLEKQLTATRDSANLAAANASLANLNAELNRIH